MTPSDFAGAFFWLGSPGPPADALNALAAACGPGNNVVARESPLRGRWLSPPPIAAALALEPGIEPLRNNRRRNPVRSGVTGNEIAAIVGREWLVMVLTGKDGHFSARPLMSTPEVPFAAGVTIGLQEPQAAPRIAHAGRKSCLRVGEASPLNRP